LKTWRVGSLLFIVFIFAYLHFTVNYYTTDVAMLDICSEAGFTLVVFWSNQILLASNPENNNQRPFHLTIISLRWGSQGGILEQDRARIISNAHRHLSTF
jgi:hypothetical protein